MKNIRRVFLTDLKHLFSSIFIIIIILGVSFLPALYAWLNIYSNWDPYGSTGNLKLAAVSLDKGFTTDSGEYKNVGDGVIADLKKNNKIDWQFVSSKKKAIKGVRDGDYYGAIVIGKDFTYSMYNVFAEGVDRPEMIFYQNQKKNPVANKISDTVVESIQDNINEEFINVMATTVFKDANDLSDDLKEDGGVDTLISKLQKVNDELNSYQSTIDMAIAGNNILSQASGQGENDAKTAAGKADSAASSLNDASNNLGKVEVTLNDYSNQVNSVIQTVDNSLKNLENNIKDENLNGDVATVNENIDASKKDTALIISNLNTLLASIDTSAAGENGEVVKSTIQSMISTMEKLNESLNTYSDAAGNMASSEISQAETQMSASVETMRTQVQDAKNQLNNNLVPQVNSNIDSLKTVLNQSTNLMNNMGQTLYGMGDVFSALSVTISASDTSLTKTKDAISVISQRLSDTIAKVNAAADSDKVKVLLSTLSGDPATYGEFFSKPVTIESNTIYPVKNYGSAVAPFYTTLAIWVGGLILMAILKAKPDKSLYPGIKPSEMFFGRYAIIFLLAEIQTAITYAGDIYIFKIQCIHPLYFFIVCAFTALVFSILIYSFVFAFHDAGKALAVVIVVLQIAGSSGTYPIELLPEFFQRVYIFFPFPYAINAMRECIAGMYGGKIVVYMVQMSLFLIVALAIGIWIQKPFHKLSAYMEKRMEDTGIF
jgi:putative membrane protein